LTGSTAGINADTKKRVTKKKAEGEMNTARMKPAQEVANVEESVMLLPVAEQSSGRSGLDDGWRTACPGVYLDMRLR
jgi:hypothetical protein